MKSIRCLALVVGASCATFGSAALAQSSGSSTHGPLTSDEAAAQSGSTHATPEQSDPGHTALLNFQGDEYSLGWRLWVMTVPSFWVNLFVHVAPGWGGSTGVATGPELVYRNKQFDIVLSAMYVDYSAAPGYFRGSDDPHDEEMVTSYLYGLYITSTFLWSIQLNRMFELQAGVGIGVGYIGGDLYRSQATPDSSPSGFRDCVVPSGDPYCDASQSNHFSGTTPPNQQVSYREGNWLGGGSPNAEHNIPDPMLWISLPQVSLHFRPHRNFDLRLDGGFALIGFFGGISAHYVF